MKLFFSMKFSRSKWGVTSRQFAYVVYMIKEKKKKKEKRNNSGECNLILCSVYIFSIIIRYNGEMTMRYLSQCEFLWNSENVSRVLKRDSL